MGLIPNDCKPSLRTVTSRKSFFKIYCYNNKVTRKVKDFQKHSNKEIYFAPQPNSTKYNKPLKFISLSNFLEEHIFSPDIWRKTFADWFRYIFSIWYKLILYSLPLNPAIHKMGNAPNILCPRRKEKKESQPYFIFYCKPYS